jgi:hypothetical protein
MCLAIILWFLSANAFLEVAKTIVQDFYWLGAQLGLSSDFATIIVAELIA